MRLGFRKIYIIGIFLALIIIAFNIYLYLTVPFMKRFFWPIMVLAVTVGWLQFWIDFFKENKRQKEIELKFLEFTRSLVETIKSGIPVPQSILHVSKEDYGALDSYVKKLSSQIEWGIPLHKSLVTFGKDTANKVIKRAVSIIIEADESGGDIGDVMDSVAESVVNVKKMKEERRTSVYSQIVQGYIVFFVFIAIMLVLQLWLFPKLMAMKGSIQLGMGALGGIVGKGEIINLDTVFFSLIMIQGFFAGIMIGKFSEGTLKQGLLHSLILMTIAAMIITTAKGGI